jgi:DNA end-binding protein Ku
LVTLPGSYLGSFVREVKQTPYSVVMARPIWSGSISFGLVSIPVKLYAAIESHRLAFHELDEKTGRRVRYRRVAGDSDREVPWKSIVRGFEVAKGRFVTLSQDELRAAAPEQTRAIDIEQFVELGEIDPVSWDQTYYVAPDGPAAAKAYALFREALARSGRVAIGRFVMRTKQYLVCLRPYGDAIALQTMFFADEVRSADDLPGVTHGSFSGRGRERELALASQIIDSLSAPWDAAKYEDTYRARVMKLVEKKAEGEEITVADEEAAPAGQVVDLMAALKASLQDGKRKPVPARARGRARAKRTNHRKEERHGRRAM